MNKDIKTDVILRDVNRPVSHSGQRALFVCLAEPGKARRINGFLDIGLFEIDTQEYNSCSRNIQWRSTILEVELNSDGKCDTVPESLKHLLGNEWILVDSCDFSEDGDFEQLTWDSFHKAIKHREGHLLVKSKQNGRCGILEGLSQTDDGWAANVYFKVEISLDDESGMYGLRLSNGYTGGTRLPMSDLVILNDIKDMM